MATDGYEPTQSDSAQDFLTLHLTPALVALIGEAQNSEDGQHHRVTVARVVALAAVAWVEAGLYDPGCEGLRESLTRTWTMLQRAGKDTKYLRLWDEPRLAQAAIQGEADALRAAIDRIREG